MIIALLMRSTIIILCAAFIAPGMPQGVSGRAVCGHAVRDTVGNREFDPVQQGTHVGAQENAVTVVDQSKD